MIFKWLKRGLIVAAGLALVGAFVFGTDAISYIRSAAKSAKTAIRDSIPTEFELQRAKDMVDQIIPEMHANIRLIAEEEVELAALRSDIPQSEQRLVSERDRIEKLQGMLSVQQASYAVGRHELTRHDVREELARRFDRFKEAELVLASKRRLLMAREKSLQVGLRALEQTKSQKALLEDKIASLEAQRRLVQVASAGSTFQVNNTKLAQADKLIAQIKKRLDVAERVLAHEARFTESLATETISEEELLSQVREHLAGGAEQVALAAAVDGSVAAGESKARQ